MSAAIKTLVNNLIAQNRVMVFSKSYCPHCAKTKSLLASKGVSVKIIELDQAESGSEMQTYLATLTGQSSVPNTFIAQKHIGGNDKLQAIEKAGQLDGLLA